ncbi:MAG: hypothetical protein ACP5GX_08475, partial [Anaerolineae bacterium]
PAPDGTLQTQRGINCDSAAQDPDDLDLDYEHSEKHLLLTWGALIGQAFFWGLLTLIVQVRKKPD